MLETGTRCAGSPAPAGQVMRHHLDRQPGAVGGEAPRRHVVQLSGLRSPYPAPVLDDTSASMISSTSTLSASRRKSTSPSTPLLRISSSRSILSLTTVVLLSQARLCPLRMTWWSLFIQTLSSCYTTSWDSTESGALERRGNRPYRAMPMLDRPQPTEPASDTWSISCQPVL